MKEYWLHTLDGLEKRTFSAKAFGDVIRKALSSALTFELSLI